jgi:hypothetical protein
MIKAIEALILVIKLAETLLAAIRNRHAEETRARLDQAIEQARSAKTPEEKERAARALREAFY